MIPRQQLRMSAQELDAYLESQRTLRLATVDDDGVPHVVPLWFVWHDGAVAVEDGDPQRMAAYRRFGQKYFSRDELPSQRSYQSVRIDPEEVTSWDFRKIPQGADRKVGLDR